MKGYKLRQHISKAIRTRSTAIKNAIRDYNQLASTVYPPRPNLDIDEVLEYTQIGFFGFLKDSRFQITEQPWASRIGREGMDAYFKVTRAHEEIERIQIEASRLLTFIEDEEHLLRNHVHSLKSRGDSIAYQLQLRLDLFTSLNRRHRHILNQLIAADGHSGQIRVGERRDQMDVVDEPQSQDSDSSDEENQTNEDTLQALDALSLDD